MKKLLLTSYVLISVSSLAGDVFTRHSKDYVEAQFEYLKIKPSSDRFGEVVLDFLNANYKSQSVSLQNKESAFELDMLLDRNSFILENENLGSKLEISSEIKELLLTLSYVEATRSYVYVDEEVLKGEGDQLNVLYQSDDLQLENYQYSCDRSSYINEPDLAKGFQKSCFNSFSLSPQKEDSNFLLKIAESFDNALRSTIELAGKEFKILEKELLAKLTNFSLLLHKDNFKLFSSGVDFRCSKHEGIDRLINEDFLFPCLESFKSVISELEGFSEKTQIHFSFLNTKMEASPNDFKGDYSKFFVEDKEFKLETDGFSFSCSKKEKFDLLDFESYTESCLDSLIARPKLKESAAVTLNYNKDGEKALVVMDSSSVDLEPKRLRLKAKNVSVDYNDQKIEANIENVKFDCLKKSSQKNMDMGAFLEVCKSESEIQVDHISIENNQTKDNPVRFDFYPEGIHLLKDSFNLSASSFKISDANNLAVVKKMIFSCMRSEKSDVFEKDDIIDDCLKSSEFKTPVVMVVEPEVNAGKENPDRGSNYTEEELSPTIKDVVVRLEDNYLRMSLKPKLSMLGRRKISFDGPIHYDRDSNEIVFEVKHTKLPLGVRSNEIFLWAVKKFLAGEQIRVEEGLIKIKL